ncbi:MAG: DUF5606 domain-containing protein [Flavobacteriaceae bacterium]|nr:DUF5606 domain-containing protein [Flavobacteriaceae bacterium]MDZ4148144.1 DUF5606 domain-containing protein [Flavobacteriaceae bacterium]
MSKKLDEILAISGQPGLYELTAKTRTGFIAKSLLTGKTKTFGVRDQVSVLSEIAIYTTSEEIPLREVFQAIQTKESDGIVDKSIKDDKKKLMAYFEEIVPEFDRQRVYPSDAKKVIQWYNTLTENKLLNPEETVAEEIVSKDEEE